MKQGGTRTVQLWKHCENNIKRLWKHCENKIKRL